MSDTLYARVRDETVTLHRTGLTPKEIAVLVKAAHGAPNKEIAQEMWLSPHTVQNHMRSIFRKLRVNNRTQAALAAYRLGLCEVVDEGGEHGNAIA